MVLLLDGCSKRVAYARLNLVSWSVSGIWLYWKQPPIFLPDLLTQVRNVFWAELNRLKITIYDELKILLNSEKLKIREIQFRNSAKFIFFVTGYI